MKSAQKGIYYAIITAVISGFSIFINKFAVKSITPPLLFITTKNSLVALFLLSLILSSGKLKAIKTLKINQIIKLLSIGLIGGALPFYLFFTGLSQIPAINAALIHKTLIFWVALFALPLLKERLSLFQVASIMLLYFSNTLIGGFTGFTFSTGELMILFATILWSIENIIAKYALKSTSTSLVTLARMGIGSIALIIASAIKHPQSLSQITSLTSVQWFWLTITAAALTSYILSWYKSLKHAPATTVASILVGSTIITNILSAIFITHTWDYRLTLQTITVSTGLLLFIKEAYKKTPKLALD